ncbi:S1 family peptidase [Arthrobacter sp. B10-11]|uniref:S1 family peptidase n=1 Tax=Arthrobacter sp. B10-11 TaxID=3081160 RepID=UPI002955A5BF|nr:trypsin-like serine protease [Arthrobacter sp. B10-11]MDV8148838.1 trypsin-like serine protease [Arthrobacter sp. B10-11]
MRSRLKGRGRRAWRVIAVAVLLVSMLFAPSIPGFAADPAGPGPVETDIAGGEAAAASEAPFAVQIAYDSAGISVRCTGSQISAAWVVTARHCDSASLRSVRLGTPHLGAGGTVRSVAARYASPDGDVLLLKLSVPHAGSYAGLSRTIPSPGTAARVFGWGDQSEGSGAMSSRVKAASVAVWGPGSDAFGGPSVRTQSRTGHPLSGDSGGPLIVGGKLVGVLSTSSVLPGGSPPSFTGFYNDHAAISHHLKWIADVAGVRAS